MPAPLVIQTEELEPGPSAWLAERCTLIVCPHTDEARLHSLLPGAAGLIVRTYTKVTAALLDLAPNLKVVARAGVALDNIDLAACRRRGLQVVHTPGANTRAVVEFATALMLDALRPRIFLAPSEPPPAPGRWHELRQQFTAPRQLSDLTLGIWGFGRIGSAMARVGAAFDMPTLYNDLREIPEAERSGAFPVSAADLLSRSDILSIHIDDRPDNHHLMSAAACCRLRPDVTLINTSRGLVIDAAALAAFLQNHPRATAMLDVHDPSEPITPDYPLLNLPNARLSPHLASGTLTAKTNMSWVVRDVWRVLNGQPPEFPAPER